MQKKEFFSLFLPLAIRAGAAFRINPQVIVAQAAIESGWGQSTLAVQYNNYFGITAYGKPNPWWEGTSIQLSEDSLSFRSYPDPAHSFMDYARLIRNAYPQAADLSFTPSAFAKEIAYSKYISEVNGDNRAAYRRMLVSICKTVGALPLIPQISTECIHS